MVWQFQGGEKDIRGQILLLSSKYTTVYIVHYSVCKNHSIIAIMPVVNSYERAREQFGQKGLDGQVGPPLKSSFTFNETLAKYLASYFK